VKAVCSEESIVFEGNEYRLRDAAVGDEELINDFFDRMGGETRALFNRGDYNRRGVLKYCAKPDGTRRYWIATDGKTVLGYVFFLDYDSLIPTLGVAVRDDLRGKHLGRDLVSFAIGMAKSQGKGGIFLTTHTANIRAQALYESLGFRCMGLSRGCSELIFLLRFKDEKMKNE
jgi:ribosomal protein S18 acetylase RimI-like enzyme